MPQQAKPKVEPPHRQIATVVSSRPSQPITPSQLNATSHAQNNLLSDPISTPGRSSQSSQTRPGPSVVIKPSALPKHEFKFIPDVPTSSNDLQNPVLDHLATIQPDNYTKNRIEQLQRLVAEYHEAKDELDSTHFEKVSTMDADFNVMTGDALTKLYDKVMAVDATTYLSSVPVETIVQIHSLCEPLILASDQSTLFNEGEYEAWTDDLRTTEIGLKAARLALTVMHGGPADRRTSSEDLVTTIVQVVKRVLEACVSPVLTSSRGGTDSGLFEYASSHKSEVSSILRLCTSVEDLLARTIRKVTLPDSALNAIEFVALTLLVHPNSASEKDSVLGIQQFERLRRAAMDVLTSIFASRPDHQQYIVNEILNSLDKLPDKGPNTRQFKSVREEPIMTVSAAFMQFVQIAATNTSLKRPNTDLTFSSKEFDEDDGDGEYDSDHSVPQQAKPTKSNKMADDTVRNIMLNARQIAQLIASTLTEKAKGVSKSAEKPYRNLLDMFVDDFCRVLGSPEWPAANLLLIRLFYQMYPLLETNNCKMAIAVLGNMGCGIIDFKIRLRKLRQDVDMSQSSLSVKLHRLTEEALENDETRLKKSDILALKDPFRMVIESLPDYLKVNDDSDNLRLLSIRGCYISNWLDSINQVLEAKDGDSGVDDDAIIELQRSVQSMFLEPNWSARE